MGLFVRKPDTETIKGLYTIGSQKTLVIVGLGNVGKEYQKTRHNAGFMAIDAFASTNDIGWVNKKDLKSVIGTAVLGETRVILCKPTTMMNLSGEAVSALASFYKVSAKEIVVLHDEMDIPFGQIRTRIGGGSAGNNGVKSVIQHIGEDFGRVRIGVLGDKPEKMETADYVLQNFSSDENKVLPKIIRETTSILTDRIFGGHLHVETRKLK